MANPLGLPEQLMGLWSADAADAGGAGAPGATSRRPE